MCGIYGFIGKPKDPDLIYRLIRVMAILTEVRGIDSTGFFAVTDSETVIEKSPIRAKKFINTSEYMKRSIVKDGAYVFVGHNRNGSIGENTSDNAHPFSGSKWVMCHNGTIGKKAFELLKEFELEDKMEGETDSEAMLHLFDAFDLDPDILKRISSYAFVCLDFKTPSMWLLRDDQRPLVVYDLRKKYGIRVIASTYEIVESAFNYLDIDFKDAPHFALKPLHKYEVDLKTYEIHNRGAYQKKAEKKKAAKKVQYINKTGNGKKIKEVRYLPIKPGQEPLLKKALIVYGD